MLPGTAFIAMANEMADIIYFLSMIGYKNHNGILHFKTLDNRIDYGIIVTHGIIVFCPKFSDFFTKRSAFALIIRCEYCLFSRITTLEILMCPMRWST